MKSIGLCMIVKNEAHVVARCLDSARPLVDYVLVEDTGSTDGSQEVIRNWMRESGIPGAVFDEPWRDFARNRTVALAKLRERSDIDYALVMDADDTLNLPGGFDAAAFKRGLDRDFYMVGIRLGGITFWRPQILSNRSEFTYKGVLHEFVAGPRSASNSGIVSGVSIQNGHDGARGRNPNQHREDAATLESALDTETDEFIRARYLFYLGQTWWNAGEKEKALDAFLKRAALGAFQQEVSLSLCYAAQIKDSLGYAETEVMGSYLTAYEADPVGAEPLHGAMEFCRRKSKPHQAYLIGKHAITMPAPMGALFVASRIYDYGVLEEFSVAAYRSGHYQDCVDAIDKLLAEGKIPGEAIPRLRENARAAREKLGAAQSAAAAGRSN
jgi:glycosyltransferase involved in cell wall biosynthesis